MSEESRKKIVYVAGKMRGVPYYNFPAFDRARDRLAGLGFEVLSPADMDREVGLDPMKWPAGGQLAAREDQWIKTPPAFDLAAAIERDNKAIDRADAIYVIHEGISESEGGTAEIERGMKGGKVILFDTMSDERILRAMGIAITQTEGPFFDAYRGETRYTDPKTGGQKGEKLARFDLLPPDIMWELAEHYGKGARKYADRNMERGYPWSKSYAACQRHLNAFWSGEDTDAETGSLHLIAAAWHCVTLAWFFRHGAGEDNRPITDLKREAPASN